MSLFKKILFWVIGILATLIGGLIIFLIIIFDPIVQGGSFEVEEKLYSPDSSRVIVKYLKGYGVYDDTEYHISVLSPSDPLPAIGNFLAYGNPNLSWVSNDTILVETQPPFSSTKKWAFPYWKDITVIYENTNPPYFTYHKVSFDEIKVFAVDSVRIVETKHTSSKPSENRVFKLSLSEIELRYNSDGYFFKKPRTETIDTMNVIITENRFVKDVGWNEYDFIPNQVDSKYIQEFVDILTNKHH
ncbi:MAG: hypothetical protein JJ892_15180 [Balneola sp.]|nr:hypothetical protein [Balneola sp.]MBO6652324.1 hypothetical protein [Balneola sp.]MBO6712920.1 hypothetical protein [Balneola sp.]MBO6801614.1 hypothetical protein [Balneola sp.]MBO6871933.1 hypothetical protein [Balneola sp.]